MKKIDHVGIAVADLDAAMDMYRDALNLVYEGEDVVESEGVKVAFLKIGESRVELLTPTREDSAVAKFLDKRGPGFHHLCFQVDDIHSAYASLKEKGVTVLGEGPRPGAHGAQVLFIHPKITGGILVELSQPAH